MRTKPTLSRRHVLATGTAFAAIAATGAGFAQSEGPSDQTVVLITGTSSGFGRLMAETFARNGLRVVASMRDMGGRNAAAAAELRELASREQLPLDVVEIDVTDQASVDRGTAEAIRLAGQIDILVNNAGLIVPGPVELQPVGSFDTNTEVNLNGSLRVFRAIAPHMRECGRGYLIQFSSGLGRIVSPGNGAYCASKAAVEAAADTLAYEEAMFGIEVTIVQPAGAYPTRLQTNGQRYLDEMLASLPAADQPRLVAFGEQIARVRKELVGDDDLDPQEIADAVLGLTSLKRGSRPRRLVVGPYHEALEGLNHAHDQVQAYLIKASGLTEMIELR